ncbi:uncharacterized protein LOC119069615 [Bradysia coprophila]|uniref:uncharacterized protein LOC119069615 n=1 Tax=Bradysia coprophila TaxID=38358 RepID=UPI00187DA25D|nr:uncharacterized protein LOC119069615 [Bradysia coprophila]
MKINQKLQFSFFVVLLVQRITSIRAECVHGNLYSHQTDCERFYQCSHGVLVEMMCYPGLHFNSLINVCDYPQNVLCAFEPDTTYDTTLRTTQEFITADSTIYETTSQTTQESTTLTTYETTSRTTQDPITTTSQAVPICDVCTPFDIKMQWSSNGPIAGKHCVQIIEVADPHTWDDNYLCFKRDYGVRWSSNNPIPGMKCTKIIEAADPHTWDDNYLCVPTTSTFDFSWSSAGAIPNSCCIRMNESADPHTWDDNYLCLVAM